MRLSRALGALALAAGLLLAVTGIGPSAAVWVDSDCSSGSGSGVPPAAITLSAVEVDHDSAKLRGWVRPNQRPTAYRFGYGVSVLDSSHTDMASAGSGAGFVNVSAVVEGLQPGTTYHFRVVAKSVCGTTTGAFLTFTTAAAPPPDAPATNDSAPGPEAGVDPGVEPGVEPGVDPGVEPGIETAVDSPFETPAGEVPAPELGSDVAVAPASGTVRVEEPGGDGFLPVADDVSVQVGSVIDARAGTASITTELPGGETQTATFWGGVFEIHQSADAGGVTDIVLRGPNPECSRSAPARSLKAAKRRRGRHLWGRDTKGRWRTRGRGSHATTRGTRWYTEERCEGTYTRVTEGAVAVRDRGRRRTVLVRAGKSYLARLFR